VEARITHTVGSDVTFFYDPLVPFDQENEDDDDDDNEKDDDAIVYRTQVTQ